MIAARQLVKCLEQAGVKWVFGVPGEENLDLVEALRTSSIQFIVTRHEQGAAMMAATVGQLTGKPGVCLATLGPGATNLITGIANANLDHQPVIAITGQSGIKSRHKGSHQYLDLQALFEPVTKWSVTVDHPDTITEMMGQVFRIAVRDKPGSVHINLPEDVAKMRVGMREASLNWISSPGVVAREKDLQHVADILNQS